MRRDERLAASMGVAPLIDAILSTLFQFVENTEGSDADLNRATDYVCDGQDVSARYRSHRDWLTYCVGLGEVTIRRSGTITEWDKMLAGHGRYLFVCGLSADALSIVGWVMVDLDVFRRLVRDADRLLLTLPVARPVEGNGTTDWLQPVRVREWAQHDATLIAASSEAGGWIDHEAYADWLANLDA